MDHQIRQLADAKVLVIGDLILDRYVDGDAERISPEAPVPVVHVSDDQLRVGGAANVAANIAALGASATLVGVVGTDNEGERLEALCRDLAIDTRFVRAANAPTTVKLRVVSRRQQLLRVDFEGAPGVDAADEVLQVLEPAIQNADVIVVSDYKKGALERVADVIGLAREQGKPVICDPKGDDFSRYRGASVVTPNLKEFETIVGRSDTPEDFERRARALAAELDLDALLVTRGSAGMSLFPRSGDAFHVPAKSQDVFDVTGAGDTVCGVFAAALATGADVRAAVRVANDAAGIVVRRFGAATVTRAEIEQAAQQRDRGQHSVLAPAALEAVCAEARRRGETLVMTNGCFDILHLGHVRYLNEAKALGTRLIVAINDDASVARLKGPARPLNPLSARAQVLAALDAVDWVVPFSADTPRELIARILPDVLVKGGDYSVADIAGASEVLAAGGAVRTLAFHDGYSTTALLDKLADGERTTAGGAAK